MANLNKSAQDASIKSLKKQGTKGGKKANENMNIKSAIEKDEKSRCRLHIFAILKAILTLLLL
jgi:hypothetical protein